MVRIASPQITYAAGKARLTSNLIVDDVPHPLWFEVAEKFGKYLCDERSDAFVLAILYWCMRKGHDIQCEAPLTDRLYHHLCDQFLPPFYKLNGMGDDSSVKSSERGHRVKIISETAPEIDHPSDGHRVGTGISCGVDSLHVFACHTEVDVACVWRAHVTTGISSMDSSEGREMAWRGMRQQAEAFCRDVGLELVVGDTNFDRECLPGLQWDGMTTFGNLFCVFALQKLWSVYYVASDCDILNFNMRFRSLWQDPARYEYFLFPHISLPHLDVRMDGQAHSRVEKVRDILSYAPARKYLNVCWRIHEGHRNGTYDCPKCMRTLLNLEVWNAVDQFSDVFDVDYYHSHFHEFLAEYYRGVLQKDNFALEMKPYFGNRKYPVPIRLRAWLIVAKKAFKKLLRFGSTSYTFSPR